MVVIESNPDNAFAAELERRGVIVFRGNAMDAAVARAASVFVMTGDDERNCRIALQIERLVSGVRLPPCLTTLQQLESEPTQPLEHEPLRVECTACGKHRHDSVTCRIALTGYRMRTFLENSTRFGSLNVDAFNVYELAARHALAATPLIAAQGAPSAPRHTHTVIGGATPAARAGNTPASIPPEFRGMELFDGAVLGKNLRPVFRDREELASSSDLGASIHAALQASRFLVVLCSRNGAKSQWVNKEIEDFKALGKGDNILALILDGEPNAASQGHPDDECFPPALRYPAEPIAGDLRKEGDGKARGFLKILAGIAQLDFDELYKRHEKIQARKRLIAALIAISLIAIFAGLAGYAWKQRNEATDAKLDAQNQIVEAALKAYGTASEDNTARLWDAATGNPTSTCADQLASAQSVASVSELAKQHGIDVVTAREVGKVD